MATSNSKPKVIELLTPRGVFVWPKLNKPDFGNVKFPKPDGEYQVSLRLKPEAAEAFRNGPLAAILEAARTHAEAEFAKLPVGTRKKLKEVTFNECGADEYDKETEEPTGFVLFKFSMKAGGERKDGTKWSQVPQIFDSNGVHLKKPPAIWGGSEGVLSFEPSPYFVAGTGAAGVSFRLKAVQLIKLVQGGQRDAAGFGFAVQDGGFDSSEYESPEDEGGGTPFDGSKGGDVPDANPDF